MFQSLLIYLTHPHVEAWNFRSSHREAIKNAFPNLEIIVCYHSRDFLKALPRAEAVIVWYFKREWLAQAENLKLISTPAAGRDWIEVDPQPILSILHGGFHGPMIAESVLGAMLYFCKAFEWSKNLQRRQKWGRVKLAQKIRSLKKARVTIWRFGRIGQEVGRKLKPFGCQITGVRRRRESGPDYFDSEDRVLTSECLPEVFKESDHLVLTLPGGPETKGLLTREGFELLPKHSYLYNVGRGNIFRETDLVDALRMKQIAGAYLDVFESEPLPEDSLLWGLDHVLIQPHLSAASPHYLDLFVEEWISNLKKGN